MANLGSVGTDSQCHPTYSLSAQPYWWWNPLNHAVVKKGYGAEGSLDVDITGFTNGRVPAILVNIIVGDFGQTGGGISLF